MQSISFHKYQATGNDFIMIDDRDNHFPDGDLGLVIHLCDRHLGIGGDGLILIREHDEHDFEMVFYNPDGSQSLCGNGSRCAVKFASALGMDLSDPVTFMAFDGPHQAWIRQERISIRLNDVQNVSNTQYGMFLDTGSPHLVQFGKKVNDLDVYVKGRRLRSSGLNGEAGTNVNFTEIVGDNRIRVRTYERGVENETLSCGTGVTAAAIASSTRGMHSPVTVETPGGTLEVAFRNLGGGFTEVVLTGPAEDVFEGRIVI